MTYHQLYRLLVPLYGDGEAKAVARMVYEVRFGLSLSDLLLGKDTQLSADDQAQLEEIAQRLLQAEPVQYVLGQATFCGHDFFVNRHVLIPRPETEELCRWIVESENRKVNGENCSVLDIGTGSGCIAITLAAELSQAQVTAWDISAEALRVAEENARRSHVHVSFEQVDALHIPHSSSLVPHFSILVSNPPYICLKERDAMDANVLEHEPHTALFVPDDDPLLFYRAIAQYGREALKDGGWLYFEINSLYAEPLCDMLCAMRFCHVEIKTDQYGKQRMIRAQR